MPTALDMRGMLGPSHRQVNATGPTLELYMLSSPGVSHGSYSEAVMSRDKSMSWLNLAAGAAEILLALLTVFLAASLASSPDPSVSLVSEAIIAPDLALQTFESQAARQLSELAACSASTLIEATLSDTSQWGKYELRRDYVAPKTLRFTPVHFEGDRFVKNNFITRLLRVEVEQVENERSSQTALNARNYKFNYKGITEIDGRRVHIFQVKPRQKRPGLFNGRIFLEVETGHIRRAQGRLVKSGSFFVKRIDFVQDYDDFGAFIFPVHLHSVAQLRLFGRAVVDVWYRDYEPVAIPATVAASNDH